MSKFAKYITKTGLIRNWDIVCCQNDFSVIFGQKMKPRTSKSRPNGEKSSNLITLNIGARSIGPGPFKKDGICCPETLKLFKLKPITRLLFARKHGVIALG